MLPPDDAPLAPLVVYGQPDEGSVLVDVGRETELDESMN